jgi:hypothetical protein
VSRDQQRRVDRLSRVAGPCAACAEREQQGIHPEQDLAGLRDRITQIKVQLEDPSWLHDEAVRLANKADLLERNRSDDNSLEQAQSEDLWDDDRPAGEKPYRVVPVAEGCRRCQEDAKWLPSPDIQRLAYRLTERSRREASDPDLLRQRARDLQERATALRAADGRSPT